MAELSENMKVKVTLEMAQDAEAFIRKLVREEVAKALAEERKTRGWQPVKEHK